MHSPLPATIGRLFWDADPKKLDSLKHQRTIIERVLNNGTLADWHWLVFVYGAEAIQKTISLKSPVRTNGIRAESARLAAMLIK